MKFFLLATFVSITVSQTAGKALSQLHDVITDEEKRLDYGNHVPVDPAVPIGPYFVEQPQDITYVPSEKFDSVTMECRAEGNPSPTYEWYKTTSGNTVKLGPDSDPRYTFEEGRLTISNPNWSDDFASYHCTAENNLGLIMSETMFLTFAVMPDFPKSPRNPVPIRAYSYGSIECNPPSGLPQDVTYAWYRNNTSDLIRPEEKPYIFMSNLDRMWGILFFSEATKDDVGNYVCIVLHLPTDISITSMPTELVITEGSPNIYETQIYEGFPDHSPPSPLAGDTVRIECWASGSYIPGAPLEYSWHRVILKDPPANDDLCDSNNIGQMLPLPVQAKLLDYNRVLEIPNIFLNDSGTYRCSVVRPNGGRDCKVDQLSLQAKPYFVTELTNQLVEAGSDLTWRCDARGEDGNGQAVEYNWFKNGEILSGDGDRVIIQENTVQFRGVDAEKDSGMYQCEASNLHGKRFSNAELRVLSVPFGPRFIEQPQDITYVPSEKSDSVTMECRAVGNPSPTYEWYKTASGNTVKLSPDSDPRYTFEEGRLTISVPNRNDDFASYHCTAENNLGLIMSETMFLTFAVMSDFPKFPRNPVAIRAYSYGAIECNPPSGLPQDVTFGWYRNNTSDLIRPEEKPYIFMSNLDRMWGVLFFSEATKDDVGNYVCIVHHPPTDISITSMPTELIIIEGSPATYEPQIGESFPDHSPLSPLVGDTVRIECWASGSYIPGAPLEYSWDRVILKDPPANDDLCDSSNIEQILPLPVQAKFLDYNRVLEIPNIFLNDSGTYRCSVVRPNGGRDCKVDQLSLQAKPYFVTELANQLVETGSDLTWRCDARGEDGNGQAVEYNWFKNGEILVGDGDRVIIQENTVQFRGVDAEKDSGMYQCEASNLHGKKFSNAELRVMSFDPSISS